MIVNAMMLSYSSLFFWGICTQVFENKKVREKKRAFLPL